MKRSCSRCSDKEFEVPDFTPEEKRVLINLKKGNRFVELMEEIKFRYEIQDIEAKFSLMHINRQYGKCNRCNVDYLEGEYVVCPKCRALNFNWKLK